MKTAGLLHTEPYKKTVRLIALPDGMEKVADARAAWKKLTVRYNQVMGTDRTADLAREMDLAYETITLLDKK